AERHLRARPRIAGRDAQRQAAGAAGRVHRAAAHCPTGLRVQTMMQPRLLTAVAAIFAMAAPFGQTQDPAPPPAPQQQTEIGVRLTGDPSRKPRLAVPDFLTPGGDAETRAAARTIAEVLHDDFAFEREFDLVSRSVLGGIRVGTSPDRIDWDRL